MTGYDRQEKRRGIDYRDRMALIYPTEFWVEFPVVSEIFAAN